uniref:flavin-containing monooxygenase FMO GS-OX5-like isoform X1 n=1 Tax=Erigeron canadensis TaxID=72917 RepID=UPI001CB991BE|nr:flavin-containing monooxygenase FMO GS-OX5-like isoform X1 [Erigeron canadensis]
MAISLKVAVIGAGVAGLTVARELQREFHQVVIFEKSHRLGGTWVYDPRVELDPLGLDPNREIVHGSLYKSLTTNLPRQLMSFTDFKFVEKAYGDPRLFPGHEEVLKYLEDFASHFELNELIRFNTVVTRVEVVDSTVMKFEVESKTDGVNSVEVFDAVVICNGNNTQPNLPTDIPGIETCCKKQIHSHNYRDPEQFRDQVVVVIGCGPSGVDLSREIATVAKEVHISSRDPHLKVANLEKHNNLWQHPKIDRVNKDGTIIFEDGFSIEADIIFHCTGYKYHVPFLKTNDIVRIQDKRIGPLYKHVFPPKLASGLSFVGIPLSSILFPLIEGQSRWIAKVLSKKVSLPSENEMMSEIEQHYREMEEKGIPERRTHSIDFKIEYTEWLYAQTGMVVDKKIQEMCEYMFQCLMTDLYGHKDAFSKKYGI